MAKEYLLKFFCYFIIKITPIFTSFFYFHHLWAESVTAKGSIAYHGDIHCSSTEYVKIKGNKSPFDGDLRYWSKRLQTHPELTTREFKLLKRQKCRCAGCRMYFVEGDIMEVDHIIPRIRGGKDTYDNLQLLHGHCHDRKTTTDGSLDKKQKLVVEEFVDFFGLKRTRIVNQNF